MDYVALILAASAIALSFGLLQGLYAQCRLRRTGHACRIPARLEIGALPILGEITFLGTGGCQFRAVNGASFRMLQHYAESDASRLRISGLCVPMHISWLSEGLAGCAFEQGLPQPLQKEVLLGSLTRPTKAPAPQRVANIRRRFSKQAARAYRSQSLWPPQAVRASPRASASCPQGSCETKPCRYCRHTG